MIRVYLKSAHKEGLAATVNVRKGETVLQAFQRSDEALAAACDGVLLCGRCWLEVLEGDEDLAPLGLRERQTLESVDAPATARLACRIRPKRDLTVRVPYR